MSARSQGAASRRAGARRPGPLPHPQRCRRIRQGPAHEHAVGGRHRRAQGAHAHFARGGGGGHRSRRGACREGALGQQRVQARRLARNKVCARGLQVCLRRCEKPPARIRGPGSKDGRHRRCRKRVGRLGGGLSSSGLTGIGED
eukprot:157202-Chlamydomonas_euryale.AAC.1